MVSNLESCDRPSSSLEFDVPHAETVTPEFLRKVGKVDWSDPVDFVVGIEAIDRDPQMALTRGEFEPADRFREREVKFRSPPAYPSGYWGLVKEVTFKYDADKQIARLDGVLTNSDEPLYKFRQLTLQSYCGPLPDEFEVPLPIDVAESVKSDDRMRLAAIFAIKDERPPILSGNHLSDLATGALDEIKEQMGKYHDVDSSAPAQSALNNAHVSLKARIVRIIIFDRKGGGILKPLYTWNKLGPNC